MENMKRIDAFYCSRCFIFKRQVKPTDDWDYCCAIFASIYVECRKCKRKTIHWARNKKPTFSGIHWD